MGGLRFLGLRLALRNSAPAIDSQAKRSPRTDRDHGSANMAVTQAVPITRHPYADGSYKKMLIAGKWVEAASSKRFETHNPATGELLATVAEGDAEDINRAVTAGRRGPRRARGRGEQRARR